MTLPKEKEGQRVCWKCEGSVSVHVAQCPYCSAFLQDPPASVSPFASCHMNVQENVTREDGEDLFAVTSENWASVLQNQEKDIQQEPVTAQDGFVLMNHLPLLSLFLGMGLVCFTLILLLFANDSGLTLHWSRKYIYLYGIPGGLLLYKGYQSLKNL